MNSSNFLSLRFILKNRYLRNFRKRSRIEIIGSQWMYFLKSLFFPIPQVIMYLVVLFRYAVTHISHFSALQGLIWSHPSPPHCYPKLLKHIVLFFFFFKTLPTIETALVDDFISLRWTLNLKVSFWILNILLRTTKSPFSPKQLITHSVLLMKSLVIYIIKT